MRADDASSKYSEARPPLAAIASAYFNALRSSDHREFDSLFATEQSVIHSIEWENVVAENPEQRCIQIKSSYCADLVELRRGLDDFAWKSASILSVRELGAINEQKVQGLWIEFTFGRNGFGIAEIITGPLIHESNGWRFIARARSTVLH
jgi:hypothetical protein